MLTILHISDLHFGPPYVPQVGDALRQIAPTLRPDVIVVSGDLTQRAKRRQFAAARRFLDGLPPVPKLVVPGNHDVPLYRVHERLFWPHAGFREHIAADLDQVLALDQAVFVALDSTAPYTAITNGRLRRRQLDFCREAFRRAAPAAPRIVVAHHHFVRAPDYLRDPTLRGSRRALRVFQEAGVEMILGGHLHRAYIGNTLDRSPGRRGDAGILIVQSGTTTSRRGRGRERQKNSFNLIDIGPEMVQITPHLYFEDEGRFAPRSRHLYPRPGRRFIDVPVFSTPQPD
jgi:3',5'-cyclic AMP phosphodiesterase CpdA